MRKTSKIILVTLIATSILLGLGYAAIQNITLNITGSAVADPNQANFIVKFTGTPIVSDSQHGIANITNDTTATIEVNGLTEKGQVVTATYEISNLSDDLSSDLNVLATNSNTEYFFVSSKLAKNSLVAGEKTTVTVTVELIKTPINESVSSNVNITMNAIPVEPGKEGTSENINNYSESPVMINEYGFYYGKAYSFEANYGIITHIFYSDGTGEKYINGRIEERYDTSSIQYEYEKIYIDGFEYNVVNNGNKITIGSGEYVIDEKFSDTYKELNEYGFYYGDAYTNSSDITYIFYEDGSVESYCEGILGGRGDIGSAQYAENSIEWSSLNIEVGEYGKTLSVNGETYTLDTNFWDDFNEMETEKNEYGFYFGEAYSYCVFRGEISSIVFYEDGTSEFYRNGVKEEDVDVVNYSYGPNLIKPIGVDVIVSVVNDGKTIVENNDNGDMGGIDPTFWTRYGLERK